MPTSHNLKAISTASKNLTRVERALKAPKDPAKFVSQVGTVNYDVQHALFSGTERFLMRESLNFKGTQDRYRTQENREWGKYLQNNNSPQYVKPLGKHLYQAHLKPKNVKRIPYPHSSIQHVKMRAVLELFESSGFCVVASVGEKLDSIHRAILIENHIENCSDIDVDVIPLKAMSLRACLWSLTNTQVNPSSNLDDFWIKNGMDYHSDMLSDRVKAFRNRGDIVTYFFKFDEHSKERLKKSLELIRPGSKFLGVYLTRNSVKSPEQLRDSLKNINTPWELAGDNDSHILATILQTLASEGLVKSTKSPDGGLFIVEELSSEA